MIDSILMRQAQGKVNISSPTVHTHFKNSYFGGVEIPQTYYGKYWIISADEKVIFFLFCKY